MAGRAIFPKQRTGHATPLIEVFQQLPSTYRKKFNPVCMTYNTLCDVGLPVSFSPELAHDHQLNHNLPWAEVVQAAGCPPQHPFSPSSLVAELGLYPGGHEFYCKTVFLSFLGSYIWPCAQVLANGIYNIREVFFFPHHPLFRPAAWNAELTAKAWDAILDHMAEATTLVPDDYGTSMTATDF